MDEKGTQENTVRMKPRKLLLVAAVILIILLALLMVIYRDNLGVFLSAGNRSGSNRTPFSYSSAAQIEADAVGNGLAVVSNNGIEIMDSGGRLAMKEVVAMKNPAVTVSDTGAAAFDIGNTNLVVGTLRGASTSVKLEDNILTATMNRSGYLAVCTESKSYNGQVTVYNPGVQEIYRWYSGEGYLITAQVSPDNRYLACLCIESSGGVVHIMKLDSQDEVSRYEEEGAVITDLRWLENNRVFLMEREKCCVIGRDGRAVGTFEFGEKIVTSYAYGDEFAVLMLCDYISGKNGSLISIGPECTVLGQTEITTGLQALDANRSSVGAMCGDGIHTYTRSLSKGGVADSEAGVQGIVVRLNADIFLITQNMALIRNF